MKVLDTGQAKKRVLGPLLIVSGVATLVGLDEVDDPVFSASFGSALILSGLFDIRLVRRRRRTWHILAAYPFFVFGVGGIGIQVEELQAGAHEEPCLGFSLGAAFVSVAAALVFASILEYRGGWRTWTGLVPGFLGILGIGINLDDWIFARGTDTYSVVMLSMLIPSAVLLWSGHVRHLYLSAARDID